VYDCPWGTDTIHVVVAGGLPREAHNASWHLFSAAPKQGRQVEFLYLEEAVTG
jgi:hypothetical protein